MNKFIYILIVLLVVASSAAAVLVFAHRSDKDGKDGAAVPVTVKVMVAGSATGTGETTGFVGTVSSSRTTMLTSPASGTLTRLSVKEGDRVTKGQVVAVVRSETVESAYKLSKASLDQAEDGWERVQVVHESGAITEVDYIKVKTQLEQARASEKAARAALERCNLKVPFDGVAETVWPVQGVELTIGQSIMRIVDLKALEVHFSLPENEFGSCKEGDKVSVTVPSLGMTLDGTIRNKGVTASPLSRSYDCTVGLSYRPEGLMPGMVCKVRMGSKSASSSIVIPSSAVMTDMEGRYVWAVKDGLVQKEHISVAGYAKDGIIVSEGLQEGDMVIIEGRRKVSTGMRVNTVQDGD